MLNDTAIAPARFGIVSYNRYANFTNYGSALQSWALAKAVNRLGHGRWEAVLMNYCPKSLALVDPLNPFGRMWDKDEQSRRMCRMSLPAIRVNWEKFCDFYDTRFENSSRSYTSEDFDMCLEAERLSGFICGSDTIFCVTEFGFDDGFFANYPCMRGRSVAYAASFGDHELMREDETTLCRLVRNFRAIALRENRMLGYVSRHVSVPVTRAVDPTLLLTADDYAELKAPLAAPVDMEKPYLLLYARRYNPAMEAFAEKLAKDNGWEMIEISLRAVNASRHTVYYEAGVEEFLTLLSRAAFVVTNSYHGMIFSMQYRRPFYVFHRQQCLSKINELLALCGLTDRLLATGEETPVIEIDMTKAHERIASARESSLEFLRDSLSMLESGEEGA